MHMIADRNNANASRHRTYVDDDDDDDDDHVAGGCTVGGIA